MLPSIAVVGSVIVYLAFLCVLGMLTGLLITSVSRLTAHSLQAHVAKPDEDADEHLRVAVRTAFRATKCRYGAARIHDGLTEAGERTSEKRIARLMQEDGLRPSAPCSMLE